MFEDLLPHLPHINATLNSIATILLVCGFFLIKQGEEEAHKVAMISAFGVSTLFLICYLFYHYNVGSKSFPPEPHLAIRYTYYFILATHVVLAISVPFLAVIVIYHGIRGNRQKHRRIARWAFPIWLYVSITGVLVYLFIHVLFSS
ncbi:MAG: DUF420 domain-containing protein [Pirellulaceae bacterium]|nr:DUF420 domain-containing protein [Pirellulaceae bacterium]